MQTVPMTKLQTLTCTRCYSDWTRPTQRGAPPSLCPECKKAPPKQRGRRRLEQCQLCLPKVITNTGGHQQLHDRSALTPTERVIARSVGLRLAVVASKARIRMYQLGRAYDSALTADQVLDEVLSLLEAEGTG